MAKETLTAKVDAIVTAAMKQAEELIKAAVRDRMFKKPYPKTFIFAMGRCFWIDSQDRSTGSDHEGAKVPRRADIDEACEQFLESFGSMGWRIDRENGQLVERDNW